MKQLKTTSSQLRMLFTENIKTYHVAELLESRDECEDAITVRKYMDERDFDVIGVRSGEQVIGYALRTELDSNKLGDWTKGFTSDDQIDENDPLTHAFQCLGNKPRLFVRSDEKIGGIVTRGDMQKAPVRMWLFALVTLTEMQLLRLIREAYPNQYWESKIKETRLEKASRAA